MKILLKTVIVRRPAVLGGRGDNLIFMNISLSFSQNNHEKIEKRSHHRKTPSLEGNCFKSFFLILFDYFSFLYFQDLPSYHFVAPDNIESKIRHAMAYHSH